MQVSPVAPSAAVPVAGHARLLLLPDILNITRLSPQAQALRQQRQTERDGDERRRRDDDAQELVTAANTNTRPNAAELAAQDERDMAPGSRASRETIASHQQQKSAMQKDAFQRTLADAAARQNASASQLNARAAPEGDAETQPAETAAPQNTSAAKGTPGTNTQPAQPSTPAAVAPAASDTPSPSPTADLFTKPLPVSSVTTTAPAAMNSGAPMPPLANAAVEALAPTQSAAAANAAASAPQTSVSATQTTVAAVNTSAAQSMAASRTTSTAAPPETTTNDTGKTDANFERILRVVRAQISGNRTRTTLQLDPPQLGKIRLQLDLHHDALTLRVEPHTELAYRLLSTQIDSLRDGLQATGVHLEHVEIRPPAANVTPETFDLPQHSGGGQPGGGAEAETDHPQHSGTDSPAAGPPETAAREANSEPSAEPRVNVWA